MSTIEIIAVISPFISAGLTGYLTYFFHWKAKRIDILYDNKIPAFKKIYSEVLVFKSFCEGRVAYLDGNEFSPFYESEVGAFEIRRRIAQSFSENSIFFSEQSTKKVSTLLNDMSILCNLEIHMADPESVDAESKMQNLNYRSAYENMIFKSQKVIRFLYEEINLPN